jgi:hypothetical protein
MTGPAGALASAGSESESSGPDGRDPMTTGPEPRSFEEFWPFYLSEHGRSGTRALHFTGTSLGLALLAAAVVLRRPALLARALAGAYGFAWAGHFFVEKNRPATFRHPLWSLRGDFRMYGLFRRGRLGAELERLGVGSRGAGEK